MCPDHLSLGCLWASLMSSFLPPVALLSRVIMLTYSHMQITCVLAEKDYSTCHHSLLYIWKCIWSVEVYHMLSVVFGTSAHKTLNYRMDLHCIQSKVCCPLSTEWNLRQKTLQLIGLPLQFQLESHEAYSTTCSFGFINSSA